MFFKVLPHSDHFLVFVFSFNFILKYNYSTSEKSHLQYNEFPPFGHIHTSSTHIF